MGKSVKLFSKSASKSSSKSVKQRFNLQKVSVKEIEDSRSSAYDYLFQ